MRTSEPFPTIGSVFVAKSVVHASHIPKHLSEAEAKRYTTLQDGQVLYSKHMWWVVITKFDRHCVCLPINTYRGQGTTKPGIKPEDHGIAWDSRRSGATLLKGEASLDAYAIVVKSDRRPMIDIASRIDFSKPASFDNYRHMSEIGVIEESRLQAFKEHFGRVHATSTTHEYENIHTGLPIPSAGYNRAVVDSRHLGMDKDGAVQLLTLLVTFRVRKKHIYIWQCCRCGFSPITYWPLCSIIVSWEISVWNWDNG